MREDIQMNKALEPYQEELVNQLQTIYDPEIGLDIYNLGLIYGIELDATNHCILTMTFTGVACTCIETMPGEITNKLTQIDGIDSAEVQVVWQPAWRLDRISRLGRITLGINPN